MIFESLKNHCFQERCNHVICMVVCYGTSLAFIDKIMRDSNFSIWLEGLVRNQIHDVCGLCMRSLDVHI